MKHTILISFVVFLSPFSWGQATEVFHQVRSNETLWFLSELYYGSGAHYQKIVKANQLNEAQELVAGESLRIPTPRYSPQAGEFQQRYKNLVQQREQKLAQRLNQIGIKQVLPFSGKSVHSAPSKSPARLAEEELRLPR